MAWGHQKGSWDGNSMSKKKSRTWGSKIKANYKKLKKIQTRFTSFTDFFVVVIYYRISK